jgi:hypothetical protein
MLMSVLQDHLTAAEIKRVQKLPAWAINLMETLAINAHTYKKDLDEARAMLTAATGDGDEQTTTWAHLLAEKLVPIGVNPDVRHKLANGDAMTVTFGPRGISVVQTGARSVALHVQPVMSNEVRIAPGRPLPIEED